MNAVGLAQALVGSKKASERKCEAMENENKPATNEGAREQPARRQGKHRLPPYDPSKIELLPVGPGDGKPDPERLRSLARLILK
jgi:hypothetical protein